MRIIGHLGGEAAARTLGDYLYVQGIENQIEPHEQGWAVWVHDEDKLEPAERIFQEFQANPADAKYVAKSRAAAGLRQDQEKRETAYRKKIHNRGNLIRPYAVYGFGRLTLALIVISALVFIALNLGVRQSVLAALTISNYYPSGLPLPEVRHGQIWRLITPIFLHFSFLHIFFNLLWLRDLGSMIEGRQSTLALGRLVLVIAIISNLGQYFFGRSPAFGGMSGVVYGLLGYVWMRGKTDPGSGLYLHPTTVSMMLIWLVLCFTGFLGPVANAAHTVGLLVGMGWGYLPVMRSR